MSTRVAFPLLLLSLSAAAIADLDPPPPGAHVWVGDHRLHLNCQGSGSPTVVFESGLGGSSLDWVLVQPAVATRTRACTYDRAGYAWSDAGPLPRNDVSIISDLNHLLSNGSVAGPYVLVGHSLGGLIVQRYAQQNPNRVAGLVLIDATHEDQLRRLEQAAVASARARARARGWTATVAWESAIVVPEGLPEEVRVVAQAFSARVRSMVTRRSEMGYLLQSSRGDGPTGALPDVPLVVISHRIIDGAADASASDAARAAIWMDMQRDLARRAQRSRHVIARTPGHYVQVLEPGTVIDAIHDVVDQHRADEK
jgi:pimeloyl-ACP methyl ester carboxylesterase